MLGVSERTFRRWTRRYEEEGEAGLIDRRLGKASGKRVPADRAEEVERLYRERYQGFTVKHFHEHLIKDHGWLGLHLAQAASAMDGRRGEGAAQGRAPEEARAAAVAGHDAAPEPAPAKAGDGSRHEWLEGQPALDLIVTLDDATGAIYSAFLVEEEGTASTFRALKEVFAEHGLPMSLYTDRGSHYFRTTKAGEIDRGSPTQVGRALAQLGVEHIGAFSPQARGRSERAFQTLQDRLVKELALAGIIEVTKCPKAKPYSLHCFTFATGASAFRATDGRGASVNSSPLGVAVPQPAVPVIANILWQNTNGQAAIWEVSTSLIASAAVGANPGPSWKAIGTGDFNHEGDSDILCQNTNGQDAIWEMNGAPRSTRRPLASSGAGLESDSNRRLHR